ncbi:MAG: zf-HC2 domain-containing protein [Acidobacteria bacterium]|nr:zf-HC2 domain-containing protein [Acidobacteriota bacterium]
MECRSFRKLLIRYPDGDLAAAERASLEAHLQKCRACGLEARVLLLPQEVGRGLVPPEASPYFSGRVAAAVRACSIEGQNLWQIVGGLARHLGLALAAVTLVFVSAATYIQLTRPSVDIYQAYDSIFMPGDLASRMIIAESDEITDESILRALAEDPTPRAVPISQPVPERD